MSVSLKARIAEVFDEPGCDKNQDKSEKERKKGCTRQLSPGAAAHRRCGASGARPIACEGNSWDNRHSGSLGPQLYRTGFKTDINELDVIFGGCLHAVNSRY